MHTFRSCRSGCNICWENIDSSLLRGYILWVDLSWGIVLSIADINPRVTILSPVEGLMGRVGSWLGSGLVMHGITGVVPGIVWLAPVIGLVGGNVGLAGWGWSLSVAIIVGGTLRWSSRLAIEEWGISNCLLEKEMKMNSQNKPE